MKRNRFGYYIKEGTVGIFNHGLMSFATVAIIVACLVIMGSFSLIAVNINAIIGTLEDENQIVAYIDESFTTEEAASLEEEIKAIPNISDAEFVTKEAAMESFKGQYKDASLLADVESSVFRDRYVIYMSDISLMSETQSALLDVNGVAKVNAHLEIADGFVSLRNVAGIISIVIIAVLIVISLFIMSNTIKLTTFERRDEIAIMKMVGATNGFIKWPFVIEGLMLGMFGALSAYIIEWAMYNVFSQRIIDGSGLSFLEFMPFASFAVPLLILYALIGLGVGIIGSLSAIRNYLKV